MLSEKLQFSGWVGGGSVDVGRDCCMKSEAELMYKCFLSRFTHPGWLYSIRYLREVFRVAAWTYFHVESNRFQEISALCQKRCFCVSFVSFPKKKRREEENDCFYALFSMHFTCKCNEASELPCSATLSIWGGFGTLLKGTSALLWHYCANKHGLCAAVAGVPGEL